MGATGATPSPRCAREADAILRRVRDAVGPPEHSGDGFAIYVGDCQHLTRQLPDSLFALTVTSPPYNIGKEYEEPTSHSEYLDWCETWIGEIHRLTQRGGAFWLNLGYFPLSGRAKAIPIAYLLWDRVPFFLVQEIVWHYGAGVAAKRSFSPRNEKFLWYVKDPEDYVFDLDAVRDPNVKYPNQRKNGRLKCNPRGKNPSDVWQFPKVTSGANRSSKERTPHPAQFPLAVVERIVKACSRPGDVVLDPFLGSGTVIEAALNTGRQAIGFEIDPRYVAVAASRTQAYLRRRSVEMAQARLF